MYNVELRYAATIVSVRLTVEQKGVYLSPYETHKSRVQTLFQSFTPLPRDICEQLVTRGEWREGGWLEVFLPIIYQREWADDEMVIRHIFSVSYHHNLFDQYWCSVRSAHVDAMAEASGLPRPICDVIYDVHSDDDDVLEHNIVGLNVEQNEATGIVALWK